MSDKLLHRKDTDAITTLTLNSPNSLNALSNDMLDKLQLELDSLKRDPNIRVIIINGSGKAFCAGHDLKEMTLSRQDKDGGKAAFKALFDKCSKMMQTIPIGRFPKKLQLQLSRKLALAFGYDFDRGRLDLAVHPFSSGSGNDVRITTRVSENDPFNCLYSTIHEVGHATYEQNINKDFLFTPLGSGVSMGVHESQSRIYENQIGRSRAFTKFLYREMLSLFGDFGIKNADDFYKSVNGIRNGFIRTEADEVQYNLHIMLRFELEKALINDDRLAICKFSNERTLRY